MTDPLADGIRCVETGDLNEARRLLSRAVSANPRSAEAWLWLGRALQDPDKQRYCFNTARDLDPHLDGVEDELAWLDMPVNPLPPPPPLPPRMAPPRKTHLLSGVIAAASLPPAPEVSVEPAVPPRVGRWQSLASDRFLLILVGILLGLLLVGIPGILLVQRGALDAFIPTSPPPHPAAETPAAVLVIPTAAPALAVETAAFTPTPTFVNAHPPKATATPLPEDLQPLTGPVSNQSEVLLAQSRFEMAIPLLDRQIENEPDDGLAYAQRGMAYFKLVATAHGYRIDEYQDFLARAIADLDEAIRLGPPRADDFYYRASVYSTLANVSAYRVDREKLDGIALVNLQAALALGTHIADARADWIDLLDRTGRCTDAQAALKKISDQNLPEMGTARYFDLESATSMCLGKLDEALSEKQQAERTEETCDRLTDMALLQYNLGLTNEALDTVNRCIQANPTSGGLRYYLLALANYQDGETDLARQNLKTGSENTWYTGGIYDYVQAHLAIDAGQADKGLRLLQEAEASMQIREGPVLLKKVRQELADLGAGRLSPTPSSPYQATPLSPALLTPPPQSATPTPVSASKTQTPPPTPEKTETLGPTGVPIARVPPPGGDLALAVDVNKGTGPMTLKPAQSTLFHFRPAAPILTKYGRSMIFHWSLVQQPSAGLELQLWMPGVGWGTAQLSNPGDVSLDNIVYNVILPNGDFYIKLNNHTDQPIELANASFSLTILHPDGTYQEYGPRSGS
jgi:tetratricopeptide (TPR) repeat protein